MGDRYNNRGSQNHYYSRGGNSNSFHNNQYQDSGYYSKSFANDRMPPSNDRYGQGDAGYRQPMNSSGSFSNSYYDDQGTSSDFTRDVFVKPKSESYSSFSNYKPNTSSSMYSPPRAYSPKRYGHPPSSYNDRDGNYFNSANGNYGSYENNSRYSGNNFSRGNSQNSYQQRAYQPMSDYPQPFANRNLRNYPIEENRGFRSQGFQHDLYNTREGTFIHPRMNKKKYNKLTKEAKIVKALLEIKEKQGLVYNINKGFKKGKGKRKFGKGKKAVIQKKKIEGHLNKDVVELLNESDKKRPLETDDDDSGGEENCSKVFQRKKKKFTKVTDEESQKKHIRERFTPLWKFPYSEQVELKHKQGQKLLLKICELMSAANKDVLQFLNEQRKINEDGLPCKLLPIIHPTENFNYNKSKLALLVGKDSVCNTRSCAGMRCGNGGCVAPLEDDLMTVPKCVLPFVKAFDEFLNKSEYAPNKVGDVWKGSWRKLIFKIGTRTNQIMMIAGFCSTQLDDKFIQAARKELKEFFLPYMEQGLTSVYFQLNRKRKKGDPSIHTKHVLGELEIVEILEEVKFKLLPQSGFPSSVWGGELVNNTVRKMGRVTKDTVLIDVSSPLSTVSLCLAKDCKQVHFIESKYSDLTQNAKKKFFELAPDNNITNWEVSCNRVNVVLNNVVKKLELTEESDALVYCDPFCGMRERDCFVLRNVKEIDRILIHTCDKKFMLANFAHLATVDPNTPVDEVYVPVEAATIDLYPHCVEYDMFVLLEKIKVAKLRTAGAKKELNGDNNGTVVIPADATENIPSTDSEVKPSTDSEVKPSTDSEVKPSTDAEGKPSTDSEVNTSTGAEVKPSTDSEVKTEGKSESA